MNELKSRGFSAFDVDYIPGLCGWVNKKTKDAVEFLHGASKEWHSDHGWECNTAKLKQIIESEDTDKLFVFGITDNQREYLNLFDKVFLMHADEDIFMQCMSGRDKEHFGHHEDDRKTVLTWYKYFEADLIENGALSVDASQPVSTTVDNILSKSN